MSHHMYCCRTIDKHLLKLLLSPVTYILMFELSSS